MSRLRATSNQYRETDSRKHVIDLSVDELKRTESTVALTQREKGQVKVSLCAFIKTRRSFSTNYKIGPNTHKISENVLTKF